MAEVKDGRDYKFIIVNRTVVEDLDNGITKTSEIAVFATLCMFAHNTTRKAFPSLQTIATHARVSERTARESIKSLERAGYVKVDSQFDKETGRQSSNIYTVLSK